MANPSRQMPPGFSDDSRKILTGRVSVREDKRMAESHITDGRAWRDMGTECIEQQSQEDSHASVVRATSIL